MRNFLVENLLMHVLIMFIIFCTLLCSCGFKGPLYLPKKPVASQPIKSASSPPKARSPEAVKVNSIGISTPSESGALNKESDVIK